jgi:hypothetical protein
MSACPYWQKNNIKTDMSRECTQLSFCTCKETGEKLGNEQEYKHEPVSVAANYESEVTML